jgi:hypothetical protein
MHSLTHDESDLTVRIDFADPSRALSVERAGETVIEPSPIGIGTPDGVFPAAYEFVERTTEVVDETIHTSHGKRTEHRLRATIGTYEFATESGRTVDFEVCVAPDGIAYRYRIGGDGAIMLFGGGRGGENAEHSGVRLPTGAVAWLFEYELNHESVGKHYSASLAEGEFTSPGLFRTGESWVLVAEAGADGDYAASRLASTESDPVYEFRQPGTSLEARLPLATPWRVALVGDLRTVAASSLVAKLVAGAPGDDRGRDVGIDAEADWIDPGRVAWSWWGDNDSPSSFDVQKEYVDYAAERGWEYVLVDEGWDAEWVPDLVEYAAERGVDVLIWAHYTGLNRADDRERKLDRWADWGVAGVKIDFMDADDQGRLQFYDEAMAATAERDLLVNFHGSVVPTGLSARWPHVLTYEGVMGAEHLQWTGLPPEHNTILPFSRNVVGSMDYTPVTFSADDRDTSAGHELALSVVFESGLQHFADGVAAYAARPEAEWFLERVPAAWDETVVLGGYPGSEATVARRRDGDWFVGSIAAGAAREVAVPLSFLDDEREAHLVCEDGTGETLRREERRLVPGEAIAVDVAENGGFCVYAPE